MESSWAWHNEAGLQSLNRSKEATGESAASAAAETFSILGDARTVG